MTSTTQTDIIGFVNEIYNKYQFNLYTLSDKKYTFINKRDNYCDNNLCHAKITLDNNTRQCSRKKKYGKLCGLHSKKINIDTYSSVNDNICIRPFNDVLQGINTEKHNKIKYFINNMIPNTPNHNDTGY